MISPSTQQLPAKQHHIVVLCLFIFLFGLQAKTSVYHDHSAVANPVASTKLWMDGQKSSPQILLPSPEWLLFAVTVVLTLSLVSSWRPRNEFRVPTPFPWNRFNPERFLRPPPAL
jgi:hypothetical protein